MSRSWKKVGRILMSKNIFSKVVIVGLGLIGGSLGKAFVKHDIAREVWGTDISTPILIQGLNDGAITHYSEDKKTIFASAEVIILAAPVDKILSVLEANLPYISDGVLITDTGSIKEKIVSRAEILVGDRCDFLGGHPMAGSEKEGIGASKAELLVGHTYIFTPTRALSEYRHADKYLQAITKIGMNTAVLKCSEHDRITANVSHLPHLIAAMLMMAVGSTCTPSEIHNFTGNGLKDTTRVSAGSPELWVQILSMNRANLLPGLEKFEDAMKIVKQALRENDIPSLQSLLNHASVWRTRLTNEGEKDV